MKHLLLSLTVLTVLGTQAQAGVLSAVVKAATRSSDAVVVDMADGGLPLAFSKALASTRGEFESHFVRRYVRKDTVFATTVTKEGHRINFSASTSASLSNRKPHTSFFTMQINPARRTDDVDHIASEALRVLEEAGAGKVHRAWKSTPDEYITGMTAEQKMGAPTYVNFFVDELTLHDRHMMISALERAIKNDFKSNADLTLSRKSVPQSLK